MDEKEYSVSEAVRLIGVESHVLRYWEEELKISIKRTGQGHRIYSQENIDTFCQVKRLKEKGIQLKAIRVLLLEDGYGDKEPAPMQYHEGMPEAEKQKDVPPKWQETDVLRKLLASEHDKTAGEEAADVNVQNAKPSGQRREVCEPEETAENYEIVAYDEKPDNLYQFEQILKKLMCEVVAEQNERLEQAIVERLRDELEEFYLQYGMMMQEAAAEGRNYRKKSWMMRLLERLRK